MTAKWELHLWLSVKYADIVFIPRKAQQKMMLLQRAIEVSESKEMSVQEYLSKVIKVVNMGT